MMKVSIKGIFLAAAFSSVAGLTLAQESTRVYVVRTGKPWRQTIAQSLKKTGTLVSPAEVSLSAKIPGRLMALELNGQRLEEGMTVKKGDRLALLQSDDYAAQLAAARATIASAEATLMDKKREFDRVSTLHDEGSAPMRDRDMAEADYKRSVAALEQAQAQATLAQLNLDETVIYAPMDGVVSARHVEPGTLLTAGAKIVTITQLNPIRFQLSVPTTYFDRISTNSVIAIRVDAYPDSVITGRISRIYPVADSTTRTVKVETAIPNDDRRLMPGMYATGDVALGSRSHTLVVPYSAVIRNMGEFFVYRAVDGLARTTAITTGIRDDAIIEVLEGLSDDDEIVTEGQHRLADGVRIKREAN